MRPESDQPIFFKQYGAMRTGTNLLRALLSRQLRQVCVLMHILGDKHAAPVDLQAVLRRTADQPDRADALVREATLAAPAPSTDLTDSAQRSALERITPALFAAVCEQRLRFIISIRDPYAWAASMLLWHGLLPPSPMTAEQERSVCESIARGCTEYSQRYRAWRQLERTAAVSIVRCEDLRQQQQAVVDRIAWQHGLERTPERAAPIAGIVYPADWDHQQPSIHRLAYLSPIYPRTDDRQLLTPPMQAAVTDSIDWAGVTDLGYAPRL